MTRQTAARVEASLRDCYPAADVYVSRVFGGLRFEVSTGNGRFVALIASENSMVLTTIAAQHGGERSPA